MNDPPQPSEADLAALADGSLPPERARSLRARIAQSPTLSAALDEQERAVTLMRGLDEAAPAALRARVAALGSSDAGQRERPRSRWWRPAVFIPAATAVAVVVAVLVIALSSGSGGATPTVPQTGRLALAAATRPPPAEDPHDPGTLALRAAGIKFPYYGPAGYETTGVRTDTIRGRRITTVFYMAQGTIRVGYAIVSGAPLTVAGGHTVIQGGIRYTLVGLGNGELITWRRSGHTCVIAGRDVDPSTLVRLATTDQRA